MLSWYFVVYATLWFKFINLVVQGVFLTGTPPKSSMYNKVNLG